MKKKLILFAFFLSILSNAKVSKTVHFDMKSSVDTNYFNGQNLSIKYIPIDLKIRTHRDKFVYFFKVRGERGDIKESNEVYRHVKTKPEGLIEDFRKGFELEKKGNNYETPSTDIIHLSKDHFHSPHEHDDTLFGHEHSIFEKDHEHHHDPNTLGLENAISTKPVKETDDLQLKLGIFYKPNKYSNVKLTLFPFSYNGDERRYHNSIVLDVDHTHLFKKNLSLTVKPKFTTYDFYIPTLVENRTYLKYALDENTVLTGYLYNGLQVNNLNEKNNFKNSLSLTYDYNTEKNRGHEFYEVLDHEHEKIDQIKFNIRLGHEGIYLLNPINNAKTKFDEKVNIINTTVDFVYKKTDFFAKDLVFSNKTKLDSTINLVKSNNRKYT
ncbi:hypothetical protein, partial [Oceanivirga salmonicida]|uniref:hypothetical protein n=1 Tax=Oceanivirga salmonicida TaxID=1769291 RepID=UPI0018D21263